MKFKNSIIYLAVSAIILSTIGCTPKKEPVPGAPANSKAVQDFVKGKKLSVKQVGFYGNLAVNGVKEIEWLDITKAKDETTKNAAGEELGLVLQFANDTAVTVMKKGKSFAGTYIVDDKVGEAEDDQPGIKLRITYPDPDFGFNGTPVNVTFTYPVLGLDDKRMMLETPRTINRQKVISMMSE